MSVNIVVVDDDPGFRRIAKTLLTARGLRVVAESEDGASALAAVREHQPDGLLLDLHLPDQDGVAVARMVREEERPPRIVLTSTEQSFWSLDELRQAGIASFIAKDRLFDADLKAIFGPPV
ncbi:response regulator transcription factor [Streptomyces mexicanus]|jgi:two-component system nitrate/nitrite response regulator NarL|uniref:response regulator transcription factor n=1 Tax=Streptomyces mexicanus TaxID=178566 RepID=UPI00368A4EED